MTLRQKEPRQRDERHLKFIRGMECCLPFCKREAEPAHLRMDNLAIGKEPTGKGEKPHDKFCVPVCPYHHRIGLDCQHNSNEREWWDLRGIDPWAIAARLWIESGGAARALEPKPAKRPRKIKARDRDAPKRKIKGRELKSRTTFPCGRKMQSRGFSIPRV